MVLESAGEAFVAMDVEGRVLMWNPAAQDTFGWSEHEATGRCLSDLIIPERYREAHKQGLRRYLETGEGRILHRRIEIEGQHRDGHAAGQHRGQLERRDHRERDRRHDHTALSGNCGNCGSYELDLLEL